MTSSSLRPQALTLHIERRRKEWTLQPVVRLILVTNSLETVDQSKRLALWPIQALHHSLVVMELLL